VEETGVAYSSKYCDFWRYWEILQDRCSVDILTGKLPNTNTQHCLGEVKWVYLVWNELKFAPDNPTVNTTIAQFSPVSSKSVLKGS
jgi:hypothetical protein